MSKETDDRVREYGEKGSITKQGQDSWNKGSTYEKLMGKEWSDDFKNKISLNKKGKRLVKRYTTVHPMKSIGKLGRKIRSRLGFWRSQCLEINDYECIMCGAKENVEVHHIKSLKNMIFEVLKENNLKATEIDVMDENELGNLVSKVIDKHRLIYGMPVCKKCHVEIDKSRRKFVNEQMGNSELS